MKLLLMLTGIALLATACASDPPDEPMASSDDASTAPAAEASTAQSGQINCATAESDLRVLRSEQTHAMEQAMGGGRTAGCSRPAPAPRATAGARWA